VEIGKVMKLLYNFVAENTIIELLYILFNRNKVVRRQQEIWCRKYMYQW